MKPVPLKSVVTIDREQRHWTERPYVGLEDLESGTGRLLSDASTTTVKSTTFGFDDRHVLYGRLRPYLNKVLLPDFRGHCSTEMMPLLPTDAVNRRYLWYWLTDARTVEAIDCTCTGARMPRANMDRVLELSIPLPSLEEQGRVVAALDKAFDAIATATANAKKNLVNARDLIERELNELFGDLRPGWRLSKLGAVMSVQSGFAFRSADYVEDGHFLVRIGNVQSGQITLKNPKYVRLEQKTQKFALQSGDILTSLTGDIGRVATVRDSDLPAAINQRVARLMPKPTSMATRDFLLLFLKSDHFRLKLEAMGHGAAQLNVSPKAIGEVNFSFPAEEAQEEILARFELLQDDVGKLTDIYEIKLGKLAALKQSLLQSALSGELRDTGRIAA